MIAIAMMGAGAVLLFILLFWSPGHPKLATWLWRLGVAIFLLGVAGSIFATT